jgi:hypothetical protein
MRTVSPETAKGEPAQGVHVGWELDELEPNDMYWALHVAWHYPERWGKRPGIAQIIATADEQVANSEYLSPNDWGYLYETAAWLAVRAAMDVTMRAPLKPEVVV